MLSFHVKFVRTNSRTDRQTDNGKTICPAIFQYRGIKMKFVLGRVENIVGKGENAGCQHFLLFPCFQKASFSRLFKVRIV